VPPPGQVRVTVVVSVPAGTLIAAMSSRRTYSNGSVGVLPPGSVIWSWSTLAGVVFVVRIRSRLIGYWSSGVPGDGIASGPPSQSFSVVVVIGTSVMTTSSCALSETGSAVGSMGSPVALTVLRTTPSWGARL
jgi:hypothetical protein